MATSIRSTEPSLDTKFAAKRTAWESSPELLRTRHQLFLGDAREMAEISGEDCVHLVVTSPPYWTLKEYDGAAGPAQLGHFDDYEGFLDELDRTWRRCFKMLTPGGRLCVVIGDVCLPRKKAGRHHVIPLHADISVRCRSLGFDYLSPIFWYKIANASTEVEGNGAPFLGKPYEPNGVIKNDVEYVLLFRKPGAYRRPTSLQRDLSVIDKADHARWFRQVWTDVPGSSRYLGHPAPFPIELAYRLISMFSFVGDTVLDPFTGTGTTNVAAYRAYRNSLGYEIEPNYLHVAGSRIVAEVDPARSSVFLPPSIPSPKRPPQLSLALAR